MNKHDSQILVQLIEGARANDIALVGFPGHTIHLPQSLDVHVTESLKNNIQNVRKITV